jgi:hypothetical protein
MTGTFHLLLILKTQTVVPTAKRATRHLGLVYNYVEILNYVNQTRSVQLAINRGRVIGISSLSFFNYGILIAFPILYLVLSKILVITRTVYSKNREAWL